MDRKSISEKRHRSLLDLCPTLSMNGLFENPAADILWELTKHYDNEETHIPMKYKHLIVMQLLLPSIALTVHPSIKLWQR